MNKLPVQETMFLLPVISQEDVRLAGDGDLTVDEPVVYGPFVVPDDAQTITVSIDRTNLIHKDGIYFLSQFLELSLDGGKTWGGSLRDETTDPPKTRTLEVGATCGGGDFSNSLLGNVSQIGLELPKSVGEPIQYRFTLTTKEPCDVGVKFVIQ